MCTHILKKNKRKYVRLNAFAQLNGTYGAPELARFIHIENHYFFKDTKKIYKIKTKLIISNLETDTYGNYFVHDKIPKLEFTFEKLYF